MANCLFVYGTLAPGKPNEHILNSIGGSWEQAWVKGHLKEKGWGAKMGYPGIILDEAGDEIQGYLFCSEKLDNHWEELDEFEGEEYKRVLITVRTKDKGNKKAYIYILN